MPLFDIPLGYETRMRILKSLNNLMQTNVLDDITVSDICANANIARQTFYRYFEDKYDAVNWYDMLMSQDTLIQIGRTLTWYEGHLKKLNFAMEEQEFFKTALRSDDYNSLLNFIVRHTNAEYRHTIEKINGIEVTGVLDFQIKLWSRIAAETTTEWILDDFPITPHELASYLDTCIPRELYHAMNDPVLLRREKSQLSPV